MVIFINQLREKNWRNVLEILKQTTGGNALKFYASVRIDIRRSGSPIKSRRRCCRKPCESKNCENKVAPPFKNTELILCMEKEFLK